MSTTNEVKKYAHVPLLLLASGMLAACATAWSGSTSAGGNHESEVAATIKDVASVTPMTPLCRVVGHRLVDIGVRRRVAAMRPTLGMWKQKEEEAAAAWDAARCPTAALAALAFGAAEIANRDIRSRTATAGR